MITILARFKVKPGADADFEAATRDVFTAVRKEPGCVALHALRDADGFVFVERYRDADALAAHRANEAMKTLGPRLMAAVDGRPAIETYEEVDW